MRKRNIQAWIFVRGDSLGLPGKNVKPLLGKPLIAYTIEAAKKSRFIKNVFVSTDSPTVAATAEQYGAVIPFLRPAELADAEAPIVLSWRHAIEWSRQQQEFPPIDILVSLSVTTPLRTPEEIDQAIELYLQNDCDSVIAVTSSLRHPGRNMVYLDKDDAVGLCLPNPEKKDLRKICPAYDISNLIHVTGAEYVMNESDYLNGRVKAIRVPKEHGLDIKNIWDFKLAEIILKETEK